MDQFSIISIIEKKKSWIFFKPTVFLQFCKKIVFDRFCSLLQRPTLPPGLPVSMIFIETAYFALCVSVFVFTFFSLLNSTTGKFIMRVTHPTSPHPLPICCCALERRREPPLITSSLTHARTRPLFNVTIDQHV